jgi:hypothetical protein
VHLKLDDTAMGVSLADKISGDCPHDQACVIWVVGFWGATLEMPTLPGLPSMGPPEHRFSVRGYAGKVEGEPTHIKVAAG